MNKKLLKEINKLKYLNQYDRGKTLTENKVILKEDAITGINKFLGFITALLKVGKSVDAKMMTKLNKELKLKVKSLGALDEAGNIITDYTKLTQTDDLKAVLKFMTGHTSVIETIMPAIRRDYKTTLLFPGDVGYDITKMVNTLSNADDSVVKALHADFIDEFNIIMKAINNPDGVIKVIVKQTLTDFKNAFGLMTDSQHAEITAKYLDNLPSSWKRAVVADITALVTKPLKWLKWMAVGGGTFLGKPGKFAVLKNIVTRVLILSGFVWVHEKLTNYISDMDNLLGDDGALFSSLPPEVKEVFCLPEADAKAAAQIIWDELQKTNPNEDTILNALSQDKLGSKLIANQIAYEFGQLEDNVGDLTLMQIMNANMQFYIDKVPSAFNKVFGIKADSAWYYSWTASDVMRYLNSETFPAVDAPLLDLKGKMKALAKAGIDEVAKWKTFRITMPRPIDSSKQALYSGLGKSMTFPQLAYLQKTMDLKGFEGEYDSKDGFNAALLKLNSDDFKNQGTVGFKVLDGEWENNMFKPADENAIPGESYTCVNNLCVKQMDDDGTYNTLMRCMVGCEINEEGNETEVRASLDEFTTAISASFADIIGRE